MLTLSTVTGFNFQSKKIKFTSAQTFPNKHYWVADGDLLITRSNTPELVGHVAVAIGLKEATIYPDPKMRPKPNEALTKFLYYQLRTPILIREITKRARGANPTMKKIGKKAVQGLPISVPSLSVQKGIVSRIELIANETHSLKNVLKLKPTALAELKQSLLQKAFSGELTAGKEAPTATLKEEEVA